MFVDKARVTVQAGKGGDGVVSFRHEIYVDRGGPDGGDGGDGGDVVVEASSNQDTLANYRNSRTIGAEDGEPGKKQKKHGKNGKNTKILVPLGTVIKDENNNVLADITEENVGVLLAQGGKGGYGNAHFKSSVRQAPRIAEKGERGEKKVLYLELKLIADVGLVGLPNAGKSTLLSRISNATPEVADYPFTTLIPHLGVVDIDKSSSLLFADIPGLIEGAAKGKGLGDDFLRHVERTAVLVHLIDAYDDDLGKSYKTIRSELKAYNPDLLTRQTIIALNKTEGMDTELIDSLLGELKKVAPADTPILAVSAASGSGIKELLYAAKAAVNKAKKTHDSVEHASSKLPVISLKDKGQAWKVRKTKSGFIVSGKKIERFAERTDFTNPEGLKRIRDIMRRMGITHELIRQKVSEDDTIQIGSQQFKLD